MITRSKIIGHPLEPECAKALTTTNECGANDNRVFSYGIYKEQSETEICDKCLKCKAFVFNAEPLATGDENKA